MVVPFYMLQDNTVSAFLKKNLVTLIENLDQVVIP